MRPEFLARLAPLVNSLLIILITYSLAQITWSLLTSDTVRSINPSPIPQLSSATRANDSVTDVAVIADWHLFGKLNDRPAPVKVKKAPETKLNLRLAGIFYTTNSNLQPLALIAEGDQAERNYKVGDFLTDSVRVHEILTDRVILSRSGRLEALTLPKESRRDNTSPTHPTLPRNTTSTARSSTSGGVTEIKAGAIAEQLRQSTQNDLSGLQQLAFTRPYVQNGQFIGFQLQPGRNRRLLRQLGLRNGDVILEVNGTRLHNPSQGMQVIQELLTADRIDAKVLRNGNEVPFTFLLNQ